MTERLALVVYRGCVAPFFPPDTLPLSLVLSPSSLLSRDLSLDSLGCEELASHVSLCCGAPLSGDEVERCSSLWDVALLAASRLTAWQTDTKMWDWADTSLPTTWTMEMRSRGKQMLYGTDSGAASGASGLLSCPVGFSKDDKLFSRLRRTKRAVSRQFVHFWQSCAKNEQQRILLLAAPLPMDANDKDFPVSLALLPNVHVEALLVRIFSPAMRRKALPKYRWSRFRQTFAERLTAFLFFPLSGRRASNISRGAVRGRVSSCGARRIGTNSKSVCSFFLSSRVGGQGHAARRETGQRSTLFSFFLPLFS